MHSKVWNAIEWIRIPFREWPFELLTLCIEPSPWSKFNYFHTDSKSSTPSPKTNLLRWFHSDHTAAPHTDFHTNDFLELIQSQWTALPLLYVSLPRHRIFLSCASFLLIDIINNLCLLLKEKSNVMWPCLCKYDWPVCSMEFDIIRWCKSHG